MGELNIVDYGAIPGGGLATAAIQKAIDECHERGGGTVIVPPGEFITGTLILKSHVHFHLESGARLKGSGNLQDYQHGDRLRGMIFAEDAINISITGTGTLDGNGSHFMVWDQGHEGGDYDIQYTRQGKDFPPADILSSDGPVKFERRPGMMIVLSHSENIVIRDITIVDSPSWTLRLNYCDDVRVQGITIRNHPMIPNNDGIHLTSSRNVRISDCDIFTGDDAIIVTGFGDEVEGRRRSSASAVPPIYQYGNKHPIAENVAVTNCILGSRSSAIRIGYGANPIRHCVFQNLVIRDTNRGIGLFVRDGADIENLLFSNITIETRIHDGHWWGGGEPIHASILRRKADLPRLGQIRHVRFHQIIAQSEAGILLYGDSDSRMEDVLLDSVHITLCPGKQAPARGGNFDLRPSAERSLALFAHDIPAIHARCVDHLILRNIVVRWMPGLADFHTYALEGEDLGSLRLDGFEGQPAFPEREKAAISLHRSRNEEIRQCTASIEKSDFL